MIMKLEELIDRRGLEELIKEKEEGIREEGVVILGGQARYLATRYILEKYPDLVIKSGE
jgi:hypothetical protein